MYLQSYNEMAAKLQEDFAIQNCQFILHRQTYRWTDLMIDIQADCCILQSKGDAAADKNVLLFPQSFLGLIQCNFSDSKTFNLVQF